MINSNFQNFNPTPAQVQNQPTMQGVYPQGYTPFVSPFPNPMPFMPGVHTPLEVTDKNGNTTIIPPQAHVQGGVTMAQGGFNPVTGMITPSVGSFGYSSNPYTNPQLIGNPGYSPGPNPQPNAGYGVYEPPNYPRPQQFQPFGYHGQPMPQYGYPNMLNPYYYNPYLAQNQFNTYLQEYLYEDGASAFDPREMLQNAVLTDEEREKIYSKRNYIGQDYYGRPIYSDPYRASQDRQNEFEQARKNYQEYYTRLSQVAHAYDGEQIDVEATMKRFDPVPPTNPLNQPKVFNWYTATEDERNEYQKDMRVEFTNALFAKINNLDNLENNAMAHKKALYAQIKASHDKLIGVEPGTHYDLKTFMDNGYKIGVNNAIQKAKSANRNGQSKYSQNSYRQGMAQVTNSQIPITSKDDEYVSIEQTLKGIYDRNRRDSMILSQQQTGPGMYTTPEVSSQVPEFGSEREAHQYFLQEIQKKKVQDEIRRSVM